VQVLVQRILQARMHMSFMYRKDQFGCMRFPACGERRSRAAPAPTYSKQHASISHDVYRRGRANERQHYQPVGIAVTAIQHRFDSWKQVHADT
jgi:hypothetical protein